MPQGLFFGPMYICIMMYLNVCVVLSAVPGPVPVRRVPGVRRGRGRGGGVARLHAGAALRLPARRRARLLARALA